jgi:hypothetical protein
VTTPGVHAKGLRTLWFLASRGVSATWGGATVVLAPPDPVADLQALEAVLRPDDDGRSYLQQGRERHAPLLRKVEAAKPADADNRQWRRAFEVLESFLLSSWADEALRQGWPHDELFAVPSLWSCIDQCGVGLLIGDREIVAVTAGAIKVKADSGSTLTFIGALNLITASSTPNVSSFLASMPAKKKFSCGRLNTQFAFAASIPASVSKLQNKWCWPP